MNKRHAIVTLLGGIGAMSMPGSAAETDERDTGIKVSATILDDFGWLFGQYSIVFNLTNKGAENREIRYNLLYDLAMNMTVIDLATGKKAPIGTFHPRGTKDHRIGLSPGCSIYILVPLMSHVPFSEQIPGKYKLTHHVFGELGELTIPNPKKKNANKTSHSNRH